MAKRQKATRFSIQSFDNAHYRTTEQYTRVVDALFDAATKAISQAAAKGRIDPEKPFSFDDYPSVKAVMQEVVKQLANRLTTTIETGSRNQWLFANKKNDGFIASIMDTSKLSRARLNKMQDQNLDALKTFQGRKVEGLNLSERVWKYVGQYREQMETALDAGLGEGRSAQQLARDVKQNLQDPNRLFRRVRDKRGNLVLSKAAKAFHPGRGVYRSSVKNAQRLTRSEINMAYRESDWQRWQGLDFVVGFEIKRSNHDPLCKCDTCAKLVGRYPKWFKFKGWHPQCMCYAVPVLMDEETFDDNELGDLKAALNGTTYKAKEAKNAVVDVPDSFKEWVKEHEEAQKKWGSTPYFIKDNFKDGLLSGGLLRPAIVRPVDTLKPQTVVEVFKGTTPQEVKDFILQHIADDCTLEIKKGDLDMWNDIVNQLNTRIQQFGLQKFSRIGKPANRQAEASWDGTDNGFNVNISFLRNQTAVKRAEKWGKRGVFYSFAYEDTEDYVRAVIDHEIGHVLMSKFGFKRDVIETFGKAGKSVFVNGKSIVEINDILGYYASTSVDEYFAEAFSFYMGKNRDKLGEHTKAMMERFMKKAGAKMDRKTTPEIDPIQQQLDALMPQIALIRQGCVKWGLKDQLSLLDNYVANKDIERIKARIATIQIKVSEMERADTEIRAKCREWGLNTYILDDAMKTPDSKNILAKMAELEDRVINAEKEYKQFIHDATQAIQEARKAKVDVSDMLNDVANISADKRDWIMGKASFKKALQDLLDAIKLAQGINPTSKLMPKELEAKSRYLHGEDYTFEKDFFDLIDPKKPIKLEILNSDSGSYSSYFGDLVHIAGLKRGLSSPWECKAVIYHEYGHCIDAQRELWRDSKLIAMRKAQIKKLNKKGEYTLYERKWNHESGGWYYERVKQTISMVEYIDKKLIALSEKIAWMGDDVFAKRGIKKNDVLEQIGSTRDTIKSLVVKYGGGHSTAYFKKTRMKETEYLAHAFENTFLGNRVFQKYLPEIYSEMITYIKALKPIV